MGHRSKVIRDEPLQEPNSYLRTEVFYQEGGTSYLSGNTEGRAYCVAVKPITKENGMVSFILFAGSKHMVQPAKRFSAKVLDTLASDVAAGRNVEIIANMTQRVLAERAAGQARDAARRRETVAV